MANFASRRMRAYVLHKREKKEMERSGNECRGKLKARVMLGIPLPVLRNQRAFAVRPVTCPCGGAFYSLVRRVW